jgi:hypothetical protein
MDICPAGTHVAILKEITSIASREPKASHGSGVETGGCAPHWRWNDHVGFQSTRARWRRSMDNLSKNLVAMMCGNLELIDSGKLQIDPPDDLPLELDTQLARYNEAIGKMEIEKAEEAANLILQWLHNSGTI